MTTANAKCRPRVKPRVKIVASFFGHTDDCDDAVEVVVRQVKEIVQARLVLPGTATGTGVVLKLVRDSTITYEVFVNEGLLSNGEERFTTTSQLDAMTYAAAELNHAMLEA